jgi:hypothetical protein
MKKKKELPKLDPDYEYENNKSFLHHIRTQVSPPLTNAQIERIKWGIFVGYKFLQDNGLTTRRLVITPEDVEELVIKVKDLTEEGLEFSRRSDSSFGRYRSALDRGTDPEKACKNILERDLKKIREGKL